MKPGFDRLKHAARRLPADLGVCGLAALALLAAAAAFLVLVLQPMQEKSRALAARSSLAGDAAAREAGSAEKLGSIYRYLEKGEDTTDWLAKLYAIGKATGVELSSASYKTQAAGARLERYEIVLPLTGSYVQMRDFLKRALAEIPVLSLDQVSLKRAGRREGSLQAELRLTLHRAKNGVGNEG